MGRASAERNPSAGDAPPAVGADIWWEWRGGVRLPPPVRVFSLHSFHYRQVEASRIFIKLKSIHLL